MKISIARELKVIFAIAAVLLLSSCGFYVKGGLPEIPATQYKQPAAATDVQVIWEFQTNGAANARATQYLKSMVFDQISASGLFTKVTDTPAASGAQLFITVNNIPEDGAFGKGFIVGLTLYIVSQTVADNYECTLRYISRGKGTAPLVHSAQHSVYTRLGLIGGTPADAQKADGINEAVFTMLRQVVSRTLDSLSRDPAFP